jgi:hypothetical protein
MPPGLIYMCGSAFPIIGVPHLSGGPTPSSKVLVILIPNLRILLACNYHPQARDHRRAVVQNTTTRKRYPVTVLLGRHINE